MDVPNTKLQMPLKESKFPFSKRMQHFFDQLALVTIGDLCRIPLEKLKCFRGFKTKCKQELITFIEFENIASLFKGYKDWKNADI